MIVSLAVYVAVRPYMRHAFCEPGAARPSKRQDDPTDASQLQDSHPWLGDQA